MRYNKPCVKTHFVSFHFTVTTAWMKSKRKRSAFAKRKRSSRKRFTRRSRSGRSSKSTALARPSVSRQRSLFLSDKQLMKFKYQIDLPMANFTSVTANVFNYAFRGNGLFDPDVNSAGHQCSGYDQWSAFFLQYIVHGSSIKITARADRVAVNPMNWRVMLFPTQTSVFSSSTQNPSELPYSRTGIIGVQGDNSKVMLKNYMSTKKIFCVNSLGDGNNYSAVTSSLPAFQWYWNIVLEGDPAEGSSGVWDQRQNAIYVTVKYYCTLFQRVPLNQS